MIAWRYAAAGAKLRKTAFSSILELHDDPIAPGTYQADAIVSGGRVATGSNVIFTAATGITLTASFSVEAGAEFLAEIAQPAGPPTGLPRDYVGGIEYYNGIMEAIYHAEGRVSFDNGQSLYEYNLTDHLGNLRLFFADRNGDGEVDITGDPATNEILQEHHYYPFGMAMEGDWVNNPVKGNRYRYNGKELNEDFGLGWYDYGARWYDASIGRWNAVDPLAGSQASFSPYHYAFVNPIRFFDPTGLIGESATTNMPIRLEGEAAQSFFRALKSTFSKNNDSDPDPPSSLVKAYGKALEALADARAEAIVGKFDQYQEVYGNFRVYEKVEGFTFDDRILGNNEHIYNNVTLTVDGQEVTVDQIIFLAGPKDYNIVTGVKDYVGHVGGLFKDIEGPVYAVMGRLSSKEITIPSGYTIPTDGLGRVRKGFIIAREDNHRRLEELLYRRTERTVLQHVRQRYTNQSQRKKLIEWLYDRKLLRRSN